MTQVQMLRASLSETSGTVSFRIDERRYKDEDRIDELQFIRHRIGEFYLSSTSGGLRVSI